MVLMIVLVIELEFEVDLENVFWVPQRRQR